MKTEQDNFYLLMLGLREALHEKELEYDKRMELSEEQIEKISQSILNLEEKEKINVKFYNGRVYEEIEGLLTKIDYIRRKIVVEEFRINVYDIISIRRCD